MTVIKPKLDAALPRLRGSRSGTSATAGSSRPRPPYPTSASNVGPTLGPWASPVYHANMSRLQEKLLELQTQQSQQAMREDRLRRAFSEPDGYFLLPRKEILEEEGEERNQNKYRATTLPLTRAQESKERRRMVMMGEEGHDDEMNDREMDDPGVSESAANAANVNVAEHIGTEVENKPHELEEAQRATQEALQIYYRAARVLRQTQEREEAIKFEYEMRALQGNSGCLHGDHAATRTRPAVGAERKGTRGAGDDAEEEEEGEEYTSLFSKDEGQALLAVDELPLFLQQERHEQKLPQQQQQHQGLPALSPIPGYEYILTPGAESSSCMREDNDQEEDMEGHGDASFKEYVFISPLMTLKTEQQDEATEPKVENDTTCTLSTASKGLGGSHVEVNPMRYMERGRQYMEFAVPISASSAGGSMAGSTPASAMTRGKKRASSPGTSKQHGQGRSVRWRSPTSIPVKCQVDTSQRRLDINSSTPSLPQPSLHRRTATAGLRFGTSELQQKQVGHQEQGQQPLGQRPVPRHTWAQSSRSLDQPARLRQAGLLHEAEAQCSFSTFPPSPSIAAQSATAPPLCPHGRHSPRSHSKSPSQPPLQSHSRSQYISHSRQSSNVDFVQCLNTLAQHCNNNRSSQGLGTGLAPVVFYTHIEHIDQLHNLHSHAMPTCPCSTQTSHPREQQTEEQERQQQREREQEQQH